jgi:hypothetical protein
LIELLEERLWPPTALRDAVAEACRHGAAPLALEGFAGERSEGDRWSTTDACARLPVPEGRPGLFQTNLERACPQRCIH